MVAAAGAGALRSGVSATTLSLSSLRTTLAYHEDFHKGLRSRWQTPAVKAELRRCPLVSLPNNKLIPMRAGSSTASDSATSLPAAGAR